VSPTEPTPTDPWRTAPLDAIDSATPPRSDQRRVLLVVAVAVLGLAAAGATGVALSRGGGTDDTASFAAATSTPTPSGDPGERRRDKDRRGGPDHHLFGGAGGALHGEFVVPDGSGGYRTMLTQRGTATKVSDSSITVRSEDGFSTTYAITAATRVGATRDGVGSIKDGADVVVVAEQKGGAATALAVADLDSWGRPGLRMGQREELGTGYGV
jgi:hypothetical protein